MTPSSPLHPDMAAALLQVKALERQAGERSALPVAEQRRLMELERGYWNEALPAMEREWQLSLAGPWREVPVLVLRPPGAPARSGWIVYLHGGGWVQGSNTTHAAILRGLALASGCTVFAVDYALAPEYPFPRPIEETRWLLGQLHGRAAEWDVDPTCMAVGGDSSGANVALAAALEVQRARPGLVRAGIFYYGVFDDDLDSGSAAEFGDGRYGLSAARMRYYWDQYLPDAALRGDGRVNLNRADLSAAFPMYLMAAGCDILRDGALRFARRLQAQGVAHQLSLRAGMAHGYLGYGRMVADAQAVHAEAAAFLALQMPASTSFHEAQR